MNRDNTYVGATIIISLQKNPAKTANQKFKQNGQLTNFNKNLKHLFDVFKDFLYKKSGKNPFLFSEINDVYCNLKFSHIPNSWL